MRIAVLMTCHNRCRKTLKCLDYLFSQDENKFNFDVFLVDDGCTDDTAIEVKIKYSTVNIIKGDGNLFWNRGMLLAWYSSMEMGKYDGVLWLNDDTYLNKDALTIIYDYAYKFPETIIVGTIASLDDVSIISYGGYLKRGKRLVPTDDIQYCNFFNGNCVFIPRKVSDIVGLLDPYYHHSSGDYDYGCRANKLGYKAIITPIIGRCDRNPPYPKWMSTELSVFKRFKILYSPLGNNPFEALHFCKNNESILRGVVVFLYLNCKALFPKLIKSCN